jgi:large subunit ribosomal protein L6
MSRIGKKLISLPKGVSITEASGTVSVKGPKGTLEMPMRREVGIEIEDAGVTVTNKRPPSHRQARAYHGMTRALLQNLVTGVTTGFERKLEINGVGYTVAQQGPKLVFNLGFSHPIEVPVPTDLQVEVPNQTSLVIRGCDKQRVGQLAAQIRKLRPPEPYKGKGIKYDDEVIKRKSGKAFGSA